MVNLPANSDHEPTLLGGLCEDDVARALVQYPERMEWPYQFLSPDLFDSLEAKFLVAEHLQYRDDHGVVPTPKLFRSLIAKKLLVDDISFESIAAILDKPLNPRDLPIIRQHLLDWAKNRALLRVYETQVLKAAADGDFGPIREELARIEAMGQDAQKSRILSYGDLMALDNTRRWIVDEILATDQPMIIGGPPKVLKTLLSLDLAVSIATGTKFLVHYQAAQHRVLYYSGESDGFVVRDHLTEILRGRDIDAEQIGSNFGLLFDPPCASRPEELARLKHEIAKHQAGVVFLDPLYMSLISANSKISSTDIHGMGRLLGDLKRVCAEGGATLSLVHHFNRKGDPHGWPNLLDLSQAGAAEFAGQWLLIRRASDYENDGIHRLNIVAGGRANSRGERIQVTIRNVLQTAEGDFPRWDILERQDQAEMKQIEQHERNRKVTNDDKAFVAALEKLTAERGAVSKTGLREELGWNTNRMKSYLPAALDRGIFEQYVGQINGRSVDCIRACSRQPAANQE